MSRRINIALAAGLVLILIGGCGKLLSIDESKTVQFKFRFEQINTSPNGVVTPAPNGTISITTLPKKAIALRNIDMVRLMVLDMSEIGSWDDFYASDAGKEWSKRYEIWLQQGDPTNWDAWKKIFKDYIPVINDIPLEIRGNEAVGTITGVVGHTSFYAGLFWGSRVKYWYAANAHGEADQTINVDLYWLETENLDPCLAKAMDLSPEEAVFNAAFKQ